MGSFNANGRDRDRNQRDRRSRAGKPRNKGKLNPTASGPEALERRELLATDLLAQPLVAPTSSNVNDWRNGPLAVGGQQVVTVYQDYQSWVAAGRQGEFQSTRAPLVMTKGEKIGLDIRGYGNFDNFVRALRNLGMEVTAVDRVHQIAEGYAPISALVSIAKMDQLVEMTPIYRPMKFVGLADNQSDRTLQADRVRAQYGVDGSGITVGVLSDSVDRFDNPAVPGVGLAESISTGDLPDNINVIDDLDPAFGPGSDEGRAMLEQIHDIAPGANLAFHTAFEGQVSFANGIRALAQAGSQIIVDDVVYFAEPFFQDGIVSQAVTDVVRNRGVTYFSSAGNSDSSGFLSTFRAVNASVTGVPGTPGGAAGSQGRFMNFNTGAGAPVTNLPITVTTPGPLIFQWDNPFFVTNGITADLDIFVLDANNAIVVSSTDNNVLSGEPLEIPLQNVPAGSFTVVIRVNPGSTDPGLVQFVFPAGGVQIDPNQQFRGPDVFLASTWGHSTAVESISTGAVFYGDAPPFSNPNPIPSEPFSSFGPVIKAFAANGTRLTSNETRLKPDVSAPDGNNTSFFIPGVDVEGDGLPNFFGTSSSAPNLAAVAALMKELVPSATSTDIRNAMITSTVPLNGAAKNQWDPQGGLGLVQALAAIDSVDQLRVVRVTPFDSQQVASSPSEIIVEFSRNVDPTTVQSSDLVFTLAPPNVTVSVGTPRQINPRTYAFPLNVTVPEGSTANGTYVYMLQAGAITSSDGRELVPFASSFTLADSTSPRVTNTIFLGRVAVVQFNEAMNASTMNFSNIKLFRQIPEGFTEVTADPRARYWFDAPNNRFIILLENLPQTALPSGSYAVVVSDRVTDLVGNRLDGEFLGPPPQGTNNRFPSGNGSAGGDFKQFLPNLVLQPPQILNMGLLQGTGLNPAAEAPRVVGTLFNRNSIEIFFSEAMDPSTVNANSVQLYRSGGKGTDFRTPILVSSLPNASVRYDANSRKAIIDLSRLTDAQVPTDDTYKIVLYSTSFLPSVKDLSGNLLDGEFPLNEDPLTRLALFPSGDGKPLVLENADNDHFQQILPPLNTSGVEVFRSVDSGIANDQNTNVTRPTFTGRVSSNFPGAAGGVTIAVQFDPDPNSVTRPELKVGPNGRGYVGTPDLVVVTDSSGNFRFQAPTHLADGFHTVRIVAVADSDLPVQAGLARQRDETFRIDTTNPELTVTVGNGTLLNELTSLSIGVVDPILPTDPNDPLSVPTQFSVPALDPTSAENISNYSLINLGADGALGGTGANADRNLSSFILRAEYTDITSSTDPVTGRPRLSPSDPFLGRIDLSFAPGLPEGSYALIARRPQPGTSGITDSAGNPIDGDLNQPGAQDLVVIVNVQPTPAYIRSLKAVSPLPDGPPIDDLDPSTYIVNDPRSYFELTRPGTTPRADAPPQQFWIDFSNSLPERNYNGFVRLIRTADTPTSPADGDFGVDSTFSFGQGYSEIPGLVITLTNSIPTAQPGQPGYRDRLRVELPPNTTLPADSYRLYIPNRGALEIRDVFGNTFDGEFLGNPTSLGGWETLMPDGSIRPSLSGDGNPGGAFTTGYLVVPNGNVIFARPDAVDAPNLAGDDPDGSRERPYSALAPEAIANSRNNGNLNSSANFGTGFDPRLDRNGNGRFDRSALFAAEVMAQGYGPDNIPGTADDVPLEDRGPVVVVLLPGTSITDVNGVATQETFVLQAPAGTDPLFNNASVSVPYNTMMVFEEGSTLKMLNASVLVQNQGSSIQLRGGGQTDSQVTFTSYLDDSVAGDTNRDGTSFQPNGGDWGGLLLRNFDQRGRSSTFPVDGRLQGPNGTDARSGADDALSFINFADIRFGGGTVPRNASAENSNLFYRYDAITLQNSRPTVVNTRVANSGGGASTGMSANFDSFREDDLGRGPLIRRIDFENNSINGIHVRADVGQPFVRPTDAITYPTNPTTLGGERNYTFDDPYPYVLTTPLHLGERLQQETGGEFELTTDRLYIQPGMMLKSGTGSGIELRSVGATLNIGDRDYITGYDRPGDYSPQVAGFQPNSEGDAKALLTSFFDDAAETFFEDPRTGVRRVIVAAIDTDNGGSFLQPTPGNVDRRARWGGVTIFSGARAVIDEAIFQYGGGTMAITEGTDPIRPVLSFDISTEIDAPFFGNGLGTRVSVTNNDFLDNFEAAIGITPNGLLAADPLRPLDSGNPFFRGNVMQRNTYDGMRIYTLPAVNRLELNPRGISEAIPGDDNFNLSVDSVWDDTDLVYIQRGSIQLFGSIFGRRLPNPGSFQSELDPNITLTIQSNLPDTLLANGQRIPRPGESAIVKLLNFNAPPGDNVNGFDPGNPAHMGAGWVVGADDGADPDGDPLVDTGAGSQIRIVGIGADPATGQERVPVYITSLFDDTVGRTVRGVSMFDTYPNPDPTFDPFALDPNGQIKTQGFAGDGGVLMFGGNSLFDYNLFDPRGGNLIDNADIRFMTRIEIQGGGIADVASTNGDDAFDNNDNVRGIKSGALGPLFQHNFSNAMTIANSNLASFSQVGVIAHPGFNLIGRNVLLALGPVQGFTPINADPIFRTGLRGQSTELFMYNNTVANMPVGVRVNSETTVGPFVDGDTEQEQTTLVMLHNTFNNNDTAIRTLAPVGQGGAQLNAFSSVRWLAMNNIFANSSVEAITVEGQQQGSQGQNNLFFGNTSNFSLIGGEGTVLIPDGIFGGLNDSVFGDPRFLDAANGDFRLRADSAAIDAAQDVLGPVDWGDTLNPISDANLIRTLGNRQGAGIVNLTFPGLTGSDLVASPGSPVHQFADQWVAALPGSTPATAAGTGANAATFHYRPVFGERDQLGLLRQDSPKPDVGQGSDPFFDIGAHEYVPIDPPNVIPVSANANVVAVLRDPTNPTTGVRLVDIYNVAGGISGFNEDIIELRFRFDARLNPSTINNRTVRLTAAGRDQQINTPDDRSIDLTGKLSFDSANNTLIINLENAGLTDDQYLITLVGSGADVIRDTQGVALDGENTSTRTPTGALLPLPSGDSFAGGNFYLGFSVDTQAPSIQAGTVVLAPSSDSGRRDFITNDATPTFTGTVLDVFPPLNPAVGQTVILDIAGPDGVFGTADDILNAGTARTVAGGVFNVTYGTDGANTGLLNPNLPAQLPDSPVNVGPDGYLGPNPSTGLVDDTGYSVARIRVVDQSGNTSDPNDLNARTRFVIDTKGPQVVGTEPAPNSTALVSGGQIQVVILTNENIDPATITSASIQAFRAGGDNIFGNANDVPLQVQIPVNPITNVPGSTQGAQRVEFTVVGATANDLYRVVLRGTGNNVVRDIATNPLDGNGDGTNGDDFELDFVVFNPANARTIYVDAAAAPNPNATGSRFDPVSSIDGVTLPGPDGVLGTADDIAVPGGLDLANPGDTVAVLPGVYRESITLKSLVKLVSAATTSSGNAVVPGNTLQTILVPTGGTGSTVAVTGTDLISQPNFVTEFSGFTVSIPLQGFGGSSIEPGSVGIRLSNSDVLLSRNYVINAATGISVAMSGALARTPRIENNGVIGNLTGIAVADGGAQQYKDAIPVRITNNTIAFNTTGLVVVDFSATAGPQLVADVANNIFAQNFTSAGTLRSGSAVFVPSQGSAHLRSNMFSNNGASESSNADDALGNYTGMNPFLLTTTPESEGQNFVGTPAFVNPRDPRPGPMGQGPSVFYLDANFDLGGNSAAIDNALNALAPARDFLNRTRVEVANRGFNLPGLGPADVGAFEFGGRTSTSTGTAGVTTSAERAVAAGASLMEQPAVAQGTADVTVEIPVAPVPVSESSALGNSSSTITLGSEIAATVVVGSNGENTGGSLQTRSSSILERFAALRARRQAAWAKFAARSPRR